MDCIWEQCESGIYICRFCGAKSKKDEVKRNCNVRYLDCIHRGEKLREEKRINRSCGCPDKTEAVYVCAILGECSLRAFSTTQSAAVCLDCERRAIAHAGQKKF